jgi:hypothetical protein
VAVRSSILSYHAIGECPHRERVHNCGSLKRGAVPRPNDRLLCERT